MLDTGISIRISGAREGSGRVRRSSSRAVQQLHRAADRRANETQRQFQTQMAREYTSAWATGRLARGITHKVFTSEDGVQVKFFIPNVRELEFVTAALGGHFQDFPVRPFVIVPVNARRLVIRPPSGLARFFIQSPKTGRLRGSRAGPITVKSVLWGKRTGGFSRDVISEVTEQEGALFVEDVQNAVKFAIEEVGGSR